VLRRESKREGGTEGVRRRRRRRRSVCVLSQREDEEVGKSYVHRHRERHKTHTHKDMTHTVIHQNAGRATVTGYIYSSSLL
tara:strand:+ start:755 stop:997 length:243 start_codon:yes stop_codon:yes gene_type:complete